MAQVTGITAERAKEIWDASVVSGKIDTNGQLVLKTRGGNEINAGAVIAPKVAIEAAWPIGSIFINTSNESPATLLGVGSWTRFANGRTLVGVDSTQTEFDAVMETGGAKTHRLTIAEMPSHAHSMSHTHEMAASFNENPGGTGQGADRLSYWTFGHAASSDRSGTTSNASNTSTGAQGGNAYHNNLQPYITVYMWRRTA